MVGVDWGTTHRRAYLLDASGNLVASQADDVGVLATRGRFAASLKQLLAPWVESYGELPVVMAGMIGSAQGWHEVPYLSDAIGLGAIGQHLCRVDEAAAGVGTYIVPGYLWRCAEGVPDVMRGEETQLLGAWQLGYGDGWYVLPGTHSKWVYLASGHIAALITYMTGELFALLQQQGTLAVLMASERSDPGAFRLGLEAAHNAALSHALFSCRARVVSKDWAPEMARQYVSGLLIGSEWHDILRRTPSGQLNVNVIGADALAARHAEAAGLLGCTVNVINSEQAFIAAMKPLRHAMEAKDAI